MKKLILIALFLPVFMQAQDSTLIKDLNWLHLNSGATIAGELPLKVISSSLIDPHTFSFRSTSKVFLTLKFIGDSLQMQYSNIDSASQAFLSYFEKRYELSINSYKRQVDSLRNVLNCGIEDEKDYGHTRWSSVMRPYGASPTDIREIIRYDNMGRTFIMGRQICDPDTVFYKDFLMRLNWQNKRLPCKIKGKKDIHYLEYPSIKKTDCMVLHLAVQMEPFKITESWIDGTKIDGYYAEWFDHLHSYALIGDGDRKN